MNNIEYGTKLIFTPHYKEPIPSQEVVLVEKFEDTSNFIGEVFVGTIEEYETLVAREDWDGIEPRVHLAYHSEVSVAVSADNQ